MVAVDPSDRLTPLATHRFHAVDSNKRASVSSVAASIDALQPASNVENEQPGPSKRRGCSVFREEDGILSGAHIAVLAYLCTTETKFTRPGRCS